jgi:hypothetical protein
MKQYTFFIPSGYTYTCTAQCKKDARVCACRANGFTLNTRLVCLGVNL